MAKREINYRHDAERDAAHMALNFLDEIVEQIRKKGRASDQLYRDYEGGDEYHRYRHSDAGYSLHEAADVLEQLGEYEADDEGLWVGLGPRDAISVMAAETYANAVYEFWKDLIDRINMAIEEHRDEFAIGPKDWSPRQQKSKLTEFVKDRIQSELVED